MLGRFMLTLIAASAAWAQTVCPPTPQYSPCEITFDIPSASSNQPLDLEGEFRSPHADTSLAKAFWDGGTRWVIRFSPAEAGTYAWLNIFDSGPSNFTSSMLFIF